MYIYSIGLCFRDEGLLGLSGLYTSLVSRLFPTRAPVLSRLLGLIRRLVLGDTFLSVNDSPSYSSSPEESRPATGLIGVYIPLVIIRIPPPLAVAAEGTTEFARESRLKKIRKLKYKIKYTVIYKNYCIVQYGET